MRARPFIALSKLTTSTRSGFAECDVHRRIIREIDAGKVIDDYFPVMPPDDKLCNLIPAKEESQD